MKYIILIYTIGWILTFFVSFHIYKENNNYCWHMNQCYPSIMFEQNIKQTITSAFLATIWPISGSLYILENITTTIEK